MTRKLDDAVEPDAQAEPQAAIPTTGRPKWTKPELVELKVWSDTMGSGQNENGDDSPYTRTPVS